VPAPELGDVMDPGAARARDPRDAMQETGQTCHVVYTCSGTHAGPPCCLYVRLRRGEAVPAASLECSSPAPVGARCAMLSLFGGGSRMLGMLLFQ